MRDNQKYNQDAAVVKRQLSEVDIEFEQLGAEFTEVTVAAVGALIVLMM